MLSGGPMNIQAVAFESHVEICGRDDGGTVMMQLHNIIDREDLSYDKFRHVWHVQHPEKYTSDQWILTRAIKNALEERSRQGTLFE